jgi:sulfur relay (sulfurtransferase) complex TusBCD TusD component (DsrE family)
MAASVQIGLVVASGTTNTLNTSTFGNVTVVSSGSPPPPTIALTSPVNGTSYTAPATITLAANVTANGHTISRVQFYNGATLLGEDTSTPYSFTWNNVSAGSYSLTAQATYDAGSTVTSSPANATVTNPSPAPTIALTSPVNGTSYTAPATITLAANVTANGHTISRVQFYNGATLLGEDTSAPYSFTWSNVSAGNYSLTARATYDAGSNVDSSAVNVAVTTTTTNLPPPWQTADIGSGIVVGGASVSNGIYTVQGAGNISGTADNFRFVYQTLTGDGEITARLLSVQNTGPNGAVGVMIRESLTSGSRYDFMGVLPDRRFLAQRRVTTSGIPSTYTGNQVPTNWWVRLVRTGEVLYRLTSTDGVNWNQGDYNKHHMAASVQIGLVVASGTTNTLNTSTFSNVNVVP